MNIVCFVQARMGSTRLPGKVTQPILGKPMLWWVMYRLQQSQLIDQVVVATTTEPQDNNLVNLCQQHGWAVFRGSENDVLDRYYQAARYYQADHIVRATSDCPLIDPAVMDYVIAAYLSAAPQPDYASNTLERRYPRGLDSEVFSFQVLETAWNEDESTWREHVTPYIYHHPDRFRLLAVTNREDFSQHRWTVDTPEDMKLVQAIYNQFGHGDFSWQQILTAFNEHPEWFTINQNIQQKQL
jgi:spore coat polysaccharide biosynthesis protein SpsF